MNRSAVIVRMAAVVLAIWSIYSLAVIPARCNRLIPLVERRTHMALEQLSPVPAAGVALENLRLLNSVAAGCRNDVNLHLLLAFNANILGRRDEALSHLAEALKVDDRPEIYYNRAMILLEAGRVDEAVDALVTSTAFNPTILDQLDPEIRSRVDAAIRSRPHLRPPL